MHFEDKFGEVFDEDGGCSAKGIEDVLDHVSHLIEEKDMPISLALEGILNIIKPGSTKRSHDVIKEFRVAMFLQGFGEVVEHVAAVWVTEFPWGIGFHFGFEEDYPIEALSDETKQAVIRSLCAVLQGGGITAEVTERGRIKITKDDGDEQDIDVDAVVSQFRNEIDQELGPTAPSDPTTPQEAQEIADWMKRWMPDQ